MRWKIAAAIVIAAMLGSMSSRAETPFGSTPDNSTRQLTPVPNAQAVQRRIWLPGIDDGYVPQGIVFLDDKLFVSSYLSTSREQDRGPCRLYALDARSGVTLGHLDLPEHCGHAGGLAKGLSGRLLVTDARMLFEIELAAGAGERIGRVVRSIELSGGARGSFAASDDDGFWIGEYARSEAGRIYKFAWSALEKPVLTPADAVAVIAAPSFSQGAAPGPAGELWIMRSGSAFGELVRLSKTGTVVARFEMPAGAEGISFEPGGALWTLSEAGSRRWSNWTAYYPLAFRFDVRLLNVARCKAGERVTLQGEIIIPPIVDGEDWFWPGKFAHQPCEVMTLRGKGKLPAECVVGKRMALSGRVVEDDVAILEVSAIRCF